MASHLVLSPKKRNNYFGRKIRVLSPAKLNLYLNILKKYGDENPCYKGFHEIESIVERVTLFDDIAIEIIDQPLIELKSPDLDLPQENNLCFQAALLFQEKIKERNIGFLINLKKNIPAGAGLGGGSSNAATTLLALNSLLDYPLDFSVLSAIAASLGSDINFFLENTAYALMTGRGEKVYSLKGRSFAHHIVWPGAHLSTALVYNNLRVKLTKYFSNVKILKYAILKGDEAVLRQSLFNVLEKSALELSRELLDIKTFLEKKNIFSKVTGSGSAIYTLGFDCSLKRLKKMLPKTCSVFSVRTF
ncbi:MAG: 4-(cytidine 5'-diphospho)-2-C-methyl-D-erythritol kinase [Candidatus Omnitrophica bacterium]|nr:4-(cytidine 5'-diphospho)-2-C-methyl-D-erythritol kinase [Candidatus Omnitrophota bacterium]